MYIIHICGVCYMLYIIHIYSGPNILSSKDRLFKVREILSGGAFQ